MQFIYIIFALNLLVDQDQRITTKPSRLPRDCDQRHPITLVLHTGLYLPVTECECVLVVDSIYQSLSVSVFWLWTVPTSH